MQKGHQNDVVVMDFAKAFDKVLTTNCFTNCHLIPRSLITGVYVYTKYRCIPFPPNYCRVSNYHLEFSTQHCLQYIFLLSLKKKMQKCRF